MPFVESQRELFAVVSRLFAHLADLKFFRICGLLAYLADGMGLESEAGFGHNGEMRPIHLFHIVLISLTLAASLTAIAADDTPAKPKQFIYVLRLVPRLYDDKAWTKEDTMAIDRHVTRFKHAIETGELILAGRTLDPGDKTFGIAIFLAPDEAAARQFMESDPAVVAGIMTAELHPFAVVFERKKP